MKWLGQWRINCMSLIQSKAFGQNTTDYWRVQLKVIHNTRAFAHYESAANRSRMKKEATHIIFLKDTKMPSIDWSFGSEHFSTNKVGTLRAHRHWQWMTKYSMLSASLKASNLGPLILLWGHYQIQIWFLKKSVEKTFPFKGVHHAFDEAGPGKGLCSLMVQSCHCSGMWKLSERCCQVLNIKFVCTTNLFIISFHCIIDIFSRT